jgi:anti-sigma regulatory factor (Ser/Thr protein kinase)
MASSDHAFHHEAFFYAHSGDFLRGTVAFIEEAVRAGEPVLAMINAAKIESLQSALGAAAQNVQFADMRDVGRNPARIIPAWRRFADDHTFPGRGLRGIGEPIWAGRGPAELVEAQHHEVLLNAAFADAERFRLLCPYDTGRLPADVLEGARRSHPYVVHDGVSERSSSYEPAAGKLAPLDDPLTEPSGNAEVIHFNADRLGLVRWFVSQRARDIRMTDERVADLVLAVDEVAGNSVRCGGGAGIMRFWREGEALVVDITDDGHITDPMVGRVRPDNRETSGRGLYIANQVCDLVQVRSSTSGSVVRLHMRRS